MGNLHSGQDVELADMQVFCPCEAEEKSHMGAAMSDMPLHVPGTENVFHLVMAS